MSSLKRSQLLPDDDHVMRCVPRNQQERDADGNAIGFLPGAFAHRDGEDYLSVNWLEYFACTHDANAAACKAAIGTVFKGNKNMFGVAQVGRVKTLAKSNAKPVRIVYYPSPGNLSHGAVFADHPTPDTGREDLAREFYKQHY